MCGNWRLASSAAAHVTEKDERRKTDSMALSHVLCLCHHLEFG